MPQTIPNTKQKGPTVDDQVARIFEWRRGFNAMHLIDLGLRLGLFAALADRGATNAATLAENLNLHQPYVETWCLTAYSFGILEAGEGDTFYLARHMDQVLAISSHPRFLGGYVQLGTEFATEDYRYCRSAFKSGGTIPFQGRSNEFARSVAQATFGLQVLSARKLLPELPGLREKLDSGGTVLEVGCGTGQHLVQVAEVFPRAKCIGVDIDPTGIALARETIAANGLANRVNLYAGDLGDATDGNSVDAVVMIEVLHEIAPRIRQSVIDACHHVLRPNGWLLIIDETYPSNLAEARKKDFLFPVQTGFEELAWGNVLPTRADQETLLRNAGFEAEINRSIIGEGFTLLTIRKDK